MALILFFAFSLVLRAEVEGDHPQGDIVHRIGAYRTRDGKIRPHGQYDDGHDGLDLNKLHDIL